MPEHVHLTPIPDSTSESIAFSSRNIPSQVVVSRTPCCTLFILSVSAVKNSYKKFQKSKVKNFRKHTLSAPARSNEHLCWLPARCASAACLGRSPKVAAWNSCGRKISDTTNFFGDEWSGDQGFICTLRGVHPSHLKTPPGYTLRALPLGGSPCNHWILQHVCFKEFYFEISGVTFGVSSCTKFQIFRGCLQRSPRPPSSWGGVLLSPPQEHNRSLGPNLRPLPVTHTPRGDELTVTNWLASEITAASDHRRSSKMVNGSRYYRALESVSIVSALSSALTIYPCLIPWIVNADRRRAPQTA